MRFLSLTAACITALTLVGCNRDTPLDTDKEPTLKVPAVPTDFEVDDSVDAKADPIDFKRLVSPVAGTATVKVTFPDAHKVDGSVSVFANNGVTSLTSEVISPSDTTYALSFPANEGGLYFLKVRAATGNSSYKVLFTAEAEAANDPCAGVECGDDEECQEGKCVEVAAPECSPKCKRGFYCVDGTCEKACGGGCKTGEVCNYARNKCQRDLCYQKKCGSGERCVSGVCKSTAPAPKTCSPACTGGATCNSSTGKCEGGEEPVKKDECSGPLSGSIVQLLPQPNRTVLVINRGSKVCVKVGQKGSISGVPGTFEITEVYEFRAKAVIAVDDKAIGDKRSIVINR